MKDLNRGETVKLASTTGKFDASQLATYINALPEYEWEVLPNEQHRRFVHIYPAKNLTDPIFVSLSIFGPENVPRYTALSYHWGDPIPSQNIIVLPLDVHSKPHVKVEQVLRHLSNNGSVDDLMSTVKLARIKIHDNLSLALRRLRRPDHDLTLWTDLLCINQKDKLELSFQVQRMANIYQSAQFIKVYLGEETEAGECHDIETALQELNDYVEAAKTVLDDVQDDTKLRTQLFRTMDREASISIPNQLTVLFRKPWFQRVWVVQEVAPALMRPNQVEFILGHLKIAWTTLILFKSLIPRFEITEASSLPDAVIVDGPVLKCAQKRDFTLISLLNQSQSMLATDLRDHCFGVLSLSEYALQNDLSPDYDESPEATFLRYTRFLMKDHGPQILSCCVKDPGDHLGLPSWAPNWSSISRVRQPVKYEMAYTAGGPPSETYRLGPDSILMASGLILGGIKIKEYVDQDTLFQDMSEPSIARYNGFICLIKSLLDATLSFFKRVASIGAHNEAIFTYMMSGLSASGTRILYCPEKTSEALSALYECIGSEMYSVAERFDAGTLFDLTVIAAATLDIAICVTDSGHLAKIPRNTEDYDLLAIVVGCHLPLVIRPVLTGQTNYHIHRPHYQIVGYAYVHGLMDGEALSSGQHQTEILSFV